MSSSFGTKRAAIVLARHAIKQQEPLQVKASLGRTLGRRQGVHRNLATINLIEHRNDVYFPAGLLTALVSVTTTVFVYDPWSRPKKGNDQHHDSSKSSTADVSRLSSTTAKPLDTLSSSYKVDWKTPALGHGTFGSVHIAHAVGSGEPVALKRVNKRQTPEEGFDKETRAFLQIQKHNGGHNHIIKLRGMYQDDDYFYLVFDVAQGGEVFEDLIRNGPYTEPEAARLIYQLASALEFLHNDVGLVHADLKPENLLLKEQNSRADILLVDFGCAEQIIKNDPSSSSASFVRSTSSGGTTAYCAPERFETARVTPATDMWSVGVILYILLTNSHPFDAEGTATDEEIQDRICLLTKINRRSAPVLAAEVSAGAQDVISGLLAIDPQRRTTASTLLQHPWILQHCQENTKHGTSSTVNISRSNHPILFQNGAIDLPLSAASSFIA